MLQQINERHIHMYAQIHTRHANTHKCSVLRHIMLVLFAAAYFFYVWLNKQNMVYLKAEMRADSEDETKDKTCAPRRERKVLELSLHKLGARNEIENFNGNEANENV